MDPLGNAEELLQLWQLPVTFFRIKFVQNRLPAVVKVAAVAGDVCRRREHLYVLININ